MKLAIIGSRSLTHIDISPYIPAETTEIVSGGAKGIDALAKAYALEKGLIYTEFLPEYEKYRRNAPLKRNEEIINYSDKILVFWDGKSKGTAHSMKLCEKWGKERISINLPL